MGGLRRKLPITFWTMLIATLSISGVPFIFSGFWSKDAVLGSALGKAMSGGSIHYYLLFAIALIAAMITAFYMFRLIFLTFFGEPKNQEMYEHAHESPMSMAIPLIILAILSFPIVNKWSFEDLIMQPDQPHIHASTQQASALYAEARASDHDTHTAGDHQGDIHHTAHNIAMVCSIIVATLGILLSWLLYARQPVTEDPVEKALGPFHTILWNKYYVDEFYNGVIVKRITLGLSNIFGWIDFRIVDGIVNVVAFINREIIAGIVGLFDMIVIDGIVVTVVGKGIRAIGVQIRRIQTGTVQNYLAVVLSGIIILVLLFLSLPRWIP